MSATTTAEAPPAPNPTTATNDNPAPTSKPTTDAPSYTSDISPPAYSDVAPTYDLAAPSSSDPSSTTPGATAASNRPPSSSADATTTTTTTNLEEGAELDATPIPFHFLIPSTPAPSGGSAPAAPSSSTTRKITHTHPVPDILLSTTAPPAEVQDLFVTVLSDVLGAHQDECRAAAPAACDVCGEEDADAGSVLLTPVSFLHAEDQPPAYYNSEPASQGDAPNDGGGGGGGAQGEGAHEEVVEEEEGAMRRRLGKRVEVLVTPVCAKADCAALARRRLRCAMEDAHNDDHAHNAERVTVAPPQGPADLRCKVCATMPAGGAKKCAGCGVVRYCGRECQRQDWRAGHKKLCATYAELVEDGRMEEAGKMEDVVQKMAGGVQGAEA